MMRAGEFAGTESVVTVETESSTMTAEGTRQRNDDHGRIEPDESWEDDDR